MHLAAESGDVECLTLLLDEGADSTGRNLQGNTPLLAAVCYGHVDAVRLICLFSPQLVTEANKVVLQSLVLPSLVSHTSHPRLHDTSLKGAAMPCQVARAWPPQIVVGTCLCQCKH